MNKHIRLILQICVPFFIYLSMSGCSTIISNTSHGYNGDGVEVANTGLGIIYSGTRKNVDILYCNLNWFQDAENKPAHTVSMSLYALVDFPFSLIADTLFLPFDISYDEQYFEERNLCHIDI